MVTNPTERCTLVGNLQGYEILLLVLVVVLLFGAKKLPEAARGVGRSLRIFKSEVKQTDEPLDTVDAGATAVPPAAVAAAPLQAPAGPVTVTQVPVTQVPVSQVPVTQVPVTQAPVTPPAPLPAYEPAQSASGDSGPSKADSASAQAVTEHFYGPERSDR